MPRTIPEWLAVIATLISGAWLYAKPDYEPAIALITGIITFVGMRSRTLNPTSHTLPNAFLPGKPTAQFDVKSLLVGAYQSDRLEITKDNLPHILPIPPEELPSILNLFYQSDGLNALRLLSQRLGTYPNPKETEKILGTLYTSDRATGAKTLVSQVASNTAVARNAS